MLKRHCASASSAATQPRSLHLSPSPARIRGTLASIVDQPDDLRELRTFHRALADVNRLRIVRRLAETPSTVTELIDHVGLSQPLVSHHLKRLRDAGLVVTRRAGRETICSLRPGAFDEVAARERDVLGYAAADRELRTRSGDLQRGARPGSRSSESRWRSRLGRLGLTPNGLTLIGFGITAVGAILLAGQVWLAGGIVVFAGGVFDMFDGTLARATGRVSRFGAFMDSVFDRWGEALVYVGLIAGLHAGGWVNGPTFAGGGHGRRLPGQLRPGQGRGPGLLARDRHGSGRDHAPGGPARDPVRRARPRFAAGRGPGVPGSGLANGGGAAVPAGILVIEGALAIIALGAAITIIQRVLHVRAQASREVSERPS